MNMTSILAIACASMPPEGAEISLERPGGDL